MKKIRLFISLPFLIFSIQCGFEYTSNGSSEAVPDLLRSDQKQTKKVLDTTHFSEINDFSYLRQDTMKILYQDKIDTIIGRRRGDTLHTDGDIMQLFSRDVRGVGTTYRLW